MPISRSKMPANQAAAEAPVTMGALQAMMNTFTIRINAMEDTINTMNTKFAELARSRPSSPTPLAVKSSTPPAQLDPPATVTQYQSSSPAKKKRNERTRKQYKRRATRVTMQSSVKEVEHTEREPGKHAVLQRIKQVPWDGSATSLQTSLQQSWCWHAATQWNGMAMVMVLWCGANGMPRIGIGWSLEKIGRSIFERIETVRSPGSAAIWLHSFNSWSISWQHITSRGSSGSHTSCWPYASVFLTMHAFLDEAVDQPAS